jgi:transposase
LLLISSYDVTATFLSEMAGCSAHTIYKWIEDYNKKGAKSMEREGAGGRRRSLLSYEEEKIMMQELSAKAATGIVLQAKDIKKEVEKKVGKSVSDDYLWDLFKRHQWVKQSPGPEHPQKDKAAQDQFKKNSRAIWMPLSTPF